MNITKERIEKYLSSHTDLDEEHALRILEDMKSLILGTGIDCPGITEAARQKWAQSDFQVDLAGLNNKLERVSYYDDAGWDEKHRALMVSALLKTDPSQKWGIESAECFEQAPSFEFLPEAEKMSFDEAFSKAFGVKVEKEITSTKKKFNEIYRKIHRRFEEADEGKVLSKEEQQLYGRMIEEIPKKSKREVLMKKLYSLSS